MDPEQAQEISERDQLWASLRVLRAGEHEPSAPQRQLVALLARIVAAEIDFRQRGAGPE
jgi:hypothetical protein